MFIVFIQSICDAILDVLFACLLRKLLPSMQVFISFKLTAVDAIIFINNNAVSMYLQRIKLRLTSIKVPFYKGNLIRLSE